MQCKKRNGNNLKNEMDIEILVKLFFFENKYFGYMDVFIIFFLIPISFIVKLQTPSACGGLNFNIHQDNV